MGIIKPHPFKGLMYGWIRLSNGRLFIAEGRTALHVLDVLMLKAQGRIKD